MRSVSSAATPASSGPGEPVRVIIARDVAPTVIAMYGAWLGAMLGVFIWSEIRRRRDVERSLRALQAQRAAATRRDEDYGEVIPLPRPVTQSEHDGTDVHH